MWREKVYEKIGEGEMFGLVPQFVIATRAATKSRSRLKN